MATINKITLPNGDSYDIEDINAVTSSEVLTKTNTTSYTPTADYHPATKKYVDDLTLDISGNTIQLKRGSTVQSSITLPVYNGGVSS